MKDTPDDPKGKETEEVEEVGPWRALKLPWSLTKLHLQTTVDNKWLQNNIFRSTGTVNGQGCTVLIDGGSCENIISQSLVGHLQLKV